jgi:hypothetical protein
MFGQVHHFVKYNKGKAPYAEERFLKEAQRLYGVLDRRLADREFVADNYSIADIAIWPWVSRYEWQTGRPQHVSEREALVHHHRQAPAVQKGYKVPKDVGEVPIPDGRRPQGADQLMRSRSSVLAGAVALVAAGAQAGHAQDTIDRPVTLYVAGTAGGGIDLYAAPGGAPSSAAISRASRPSRCR